MDDLYARISTNGQDLGGQIADLQAAGCGKIYREKISWARTDRRELAKLLRRPGRTSARVMPHTVQSMCPHSNRTGRSSGKLSPLSVAPVRNRLADRGSYGRECGAIVPTTARVFDRNSS
jgi:hypothetical protein